MDLVCREVNAIAKTGGLSLHGVVELHHEIEEIQQALHRNRWRRVPRPLRVSPRLLGPRPRRALSRRAAANPWHDWDRRGRRRFPGKTPMQT